MPVTPIIRFGHGPDADDAFVFEPLIHGRIDTEDLEFHHAHRSFDLLNRAAAGDDPPEVTMVSVATLARLTGRFHALGFGGSFVGTMGPMLVAAQRAPLSAFDDSLIAVPGLGTTATLLLRLAVPNARLLVVPYDRIAETVAAGEADAGVVIHEGQIDFERHGLELVVDLGMWWKRRHCLPTPLAVCAIRADLPRELRSRIVRVLARSLTSARTAPDTPLEFATGFTGGLGADAARALVEEYVSADTYALGAIAREAIRVLVGQAQQIDAPPALVFADAA